MQRDGKLRTQIAKMYKNTHKESERDKRAMNKHCIYTTDTCVL